MPNEITVANIQADFDAAGCELELASSNPPAVPDVTTDDGDDLADTVEAVRYELARPTPESLAEQRALEEVPQVLRNVPVDDLAVFDKPGQAMLAAGL